MISHATNFKMTIYYSWLIIFIMILRVDAAISDIVDVKSNRTCSNKMDENSTVVFQTLEDTTWVERTMNNIKVNSYYNNNNNTRKFNTEFNNINYKITIAADMFFISLKLKKDKLVLSLSRMRKKMKFDCIETTCNGTMRICSCVEKESNINGSKKLESICQQSPLEAKAVVSITESPPPLELTTQVPSTTEHNSTSVITQINEVLQEQSNNSESNYSALVVLLAVSVIIIFVLFITVWKLKKKIEKHKNEDFICQTLTNNEVVSALLGPISTLSSRYNEPIRRTSDPMVIMSTEYSDKAVQTPMKHNANSFILQDFDSGSLTYNQCVQTYISTPEIRNILCTEKLELLGKGFSMSCPDMDKSDSHSDSSDSSSNRKDLKKLWVRASSSNSIALAKINECDMSNIEQVKLNEEHLKVKQSVVLPQQLQLDNVTEITELFTLDNRTYFISKSALETAKQMC